MANIKLQKKAETVTANAERMTDIIAAVEEVVNEAIQGIYDEHLDTSEEANNDGPFIRVKFKPNKKGGELGKYTPELVETVTLQSGQEREIVDVYDLCNGFPNEAKAWAEAYKHWPQVRLPESKRIEDAIASATAAFLGQVKRGVIRARQMTRAYELCDSEGLSVNNAMERIKELDKAAADAANEDSPSAPRAVTADDDSLFE